jgi:hypothetical protein
MASERGGFRFPHGARRRSARGTALRAAAAALALGLAASAAAYVPPAPAILKRVVQKRDDLKLSALEVRGSATFAGETARRVAALSGAPAAGGGPAGAGPGTAVPAPGTPAVLALKVPGRCRLELQREGGAAADRPSVSLRGARLTGHRGLEAVPAARALVEALCTLLGERGAGPPEPERPLAQALANRGVSLTEVALGRVGGRIAWVLGGRSQDARPQAWVDKTTFQPLRLVATVAGTPLDVRLVDFGSPVGGDAFPRAIEVWAGEELQLRFTAERVTQNPRLADALF